jgi:hypothetical protein
MKEILTEIFEPVFYKKDTILHIVFQAKVPPLKEVKEKPS